MKKRVTAVLLLGALVLSMAGCSYDGNASKTAGLKKKVDSIEVCDVSGKTKVDVTMGDTGQKIDFIFKMSSGGESGNYTQIAIPTDVSDYKYEDGSGKITLSSKEGYDVVVTAQDYTGATTVPNAVVDAEKNSADATAKQNDGEASVLKDEFGKCVIMMTYDRNTELYAYFYTGSVLVKYKISYKSDGSQSLVSEAKLFTKKLTGVDL